MLLFEAALLEQSSLIVENVLAVALVSVAGERSKTVRGVVGLAAVRERSLLGRMRRCSVVARDNAG